MKRMQNATNPLFRFALFLVLGSAGASVAASPQVDLQWLGRDADKVSKLAPHAGGDGVLDHHFRLRLHGAPAAPIIAIELRDHENLAPDTLVWRSNDADDEPGVIEHRALEHLLVERNGRVLNTTPKGALGSHPGEVALDLYAHDIGQWDVYRSVVAEVQFADGRKLTRTTTLTWPPNRLMGVWQLLCPPGDANAFEPMTMSGRVLMLLQDDGRIGGWFGQLPLTGTLDAKGHVQGRAGNADADVEWQGELVVFARGQPAVGSGSFRFSRSRKECVGEGAWTSK